MKQKRAKKSNSNSNMAIDKYSAYGAGSSFAGQLGKDGGKFRTPNPIQIEEDVLMIAAGGMHSVFLTKKGIYTCGCGDIYATGRKDDEDEVILQVQSTNISYVAASDSMTLFVTQGQLYAFGTFKDENGGKKFNKTTEIQQTPSLVPINDRVVSVVCGSDHALILCESKDCYAIGVDTLYQIGYRTSARIQDDRWITCDRPLCKNIVLTGAGDFHSVIVSDTGNIYTCGLNGFGQCGYLRTNATATVTFALNKQLTMFFKQKGLELKQVEGGVANTLFLTTNGEVYAIGKSDGGMLCKSVEYVGEEYSFEPIKIEFSKKVIIDSVSTGGNACIAVSTDGVAYSWVNHINLGPNSQLRNSSWH
eukprot:NODE_68_length_25399_cov_0.885771.p8 type:complete len:362 gc:universal NODE_68_length_25399_cov_0.885771:20337-21422(+)